MWRGWAIVCGSLAISGAAVAQANPQLPQWDAKAHCDRQNRIIATESAFLLRACLQQEDNAEAMLRPGWDALSAASRRTCLAQQQTLRMTSYFLLNACVEMERGAETYIQQRPPRR